MGTLILVATPIGNLADLSPRAVEALGSADLICCEDTRRSGRLLQHAGITSRRLRRVDEHTETAAVVDVLQVLEGGGTVAVITDAGTPGISDPGQRLVHAVADAGHVVSAIPGPAALVMALVISGLPTDRFVFEGFLPRTGRARHERIAEIAAERRTVVMYEAPHRIGRTMEDLRDVCGDGRRVALCRELTKLHEEVWRGSLVEAVAHVAQREPIGEYVVVLEGAPATPAASDDDVADLVRRAIATGSSKRDAATDVAKLTGRPKRDVYDMALKVR